MTCLTQHAPQSHAPSDLLVELGYSKSLILNPWYDPVPEVITFADFAVGLPSYEMKHENILVVLHEPISPGHH